MNLAKILPMTFVMIAGPQILSAIFLATSDGWRRNSVAYITGAALSITAIISASYFFINGRIGRGRVERHDRHRGPRPTGAWRDSTPISSARNRSRPSGWASSKTRTPKFSFKLGFLLLGVFPTDILTSVAVGQYLANHDSPWWHCGVFVAVTLFLLATSPARPARVRRARSGRDAEGPRLDEQQLVGRARRS